MDRTFVCVQCAPAFERLSFGSSGRLAKFIASAAADRARSAGIDPTRGCPGCGTSLVGILTDAAAGCEVCYEHFSSDLIPAITSIHGWSAHDGKSV